jgi:hypothetical protein
MFRPLPRPQTRRVSFQKVIRRPVTVPDGFRSFVCAVWSTTPISRLSPPTSAFLKIRGIARLQVSQLQRKTCLHPHRLFPHRLRSLWPRVFEFFWSSPPTVPISQLSTVPFVSGHILAHLDSISTRFALDFPPDDDTVHAVLRRAAPVFDHSQPSTSGKMGFGNLGQLW